VLLVPAHTAPYKADRDGGWDARDPGPEHRLRMCRLAVDGVAGLSVSAVEVERGGLSYTVDTLTSIHASHPDAELTFIVGADTAGTLPTWRQPARVLQLARLAVAARAGAERRRVLDALSGLGVGAADVSFLEMPAIDVSSSLVRRRAGAGEPIEALVGPAVAAYVAEHRLYRAGAEAVLR
jgi:nicotinate-nucleotide adenylyltransferase